MELGSGEAFGLVYAGCELFSDEYGIRLAGDELEDRRRKKLDDFVFCSFFLNKFN